MAVSEREPLRDRLGFALEVGLLVALAEGSAALFLGIREPVFFGLQSAAAVGACLLLALVPLPRPWRAVLPWLGAGGLHLAGIALEEAGVRSPAGALVLGLHLACAAALGILWTRLTPRRGLRTALALALVSQALLAAALLFPLEQSARPGWLVPVGVLTVTVVPALFGLLGAWIRAGDAERPGATAARLGALVPAVILLGLALAAHWPWTWASHLRASAAPASAAADSEAPRGPDVVVIVMDATRADRLSLYGHDRRTTPHLEEFAATATVYDRALSQGTWTLPGHASMFTGLYLSEHEADNDLDGWSLPLQDASRTLAETLRDAGYRTGCVAANHGMFIDGFGLPQGFETKWAEPGLTKHLVYPALVRELAHRLGGHVARKRIGPLERNQFASAREINRVGLRWLGRGARGERPSFLFLNYMEVHSTFRRVPCGAPRFGSGVSWSHYDVPNFDAVMAGTEDAAAEWTTRVRDWYDSSVACLDLHLGELFDGLRAMGRFDSSLVVVTSDHGQMLGEERSFHHKSEVWEGLLHVPLIVKLPGQRAGTRCAEPVETAALARAIPALLGSAAGASRPSSAASAPCPLSALGARHGFAAAETRRTWDLAQAHPERWDRDYLALIDGGLKFVEDSRGERWVVELDGAEPAGPSADAARRALTPEEHARFEELEAEWSADLRDPLVRRPATDEEREDRLKSLRGLGYVGDDR